ncbi:MAG: ABC transporter permease [Fimbriimonas sp.]
MAIAVQRPPFAKRMLRDYGVLVAFLVLFLVSAAWKPAFFLQPENLRNLLNQNASVGIVAIGMTLVVVAGGIDLSVGSIMALAGAVALWTLNKANGPGAEVKAVIMGVLACLGTGTALGLLNGVLITFGRIAPFIATLGGLVAYRSVVVALSEAGEIRSTSANLFPEIGTGGIPIPFLRNSANQPIELTWNILLFVVVAVAATFVLNRTVFGRHVVAVGANERAARYSAIDTRRVRLMTYVFLGLCTSLAALIQSSRTNSVASSTMGLYSELDAIAAVVIGGTSLAGGRGQVWGTVVGVLILGVINNILVLGDVSAYWQGLVKGAIILLAVLIQRGGDDR